MLLVLIATTLLAGLLGMHVLSSGAMSPQGAHAMPAAHSAGPAALSATAEIGASDAGDRALSNHPCSGTPTTAASDSSCPLAVSAPSIFVADVARAQPQGARDLAPAAPSRPDSVRRFALTPVQLAISRT